MCFILSPAPYLSLLGPFYIITGEKGCYSGPANGSFKCKPKQIVNHTLASSAININLAKKQGRINNRACKQHLQNVIQAEIRADTLKK